MFPLGIRLLVLMLPVGSIAFDPHSQCLWQDKVCRKSDWNDEYECLRDFNSLQEVLDCVEKDEEGRIKDPICHDRNPEDDGFDLSSYTWVDSLGSWCTSPRTLVIETWIEQLSREQKRDCPILGQLRACPRDDPNYHNCLCENGVLPEHLQILVPSFRLYEHQVDQLSYGLACPQYPRGISREVTRSLPIVERKNDGWSKACENCDFDITTDGLPVYNDDDRLYTGLYPLPTHDSLIKDGKALKRCYVHPEEPVEVSCTAWWLAARSTSSSSRSSVPKATYTSYYHYDDSSFTASSEPPIASRPSTSMSYTGSVGSKPLVTSTTGPETSTPSGGVSLNVWVSVLVWRLLALCMVVFTLVL